MSQRDHGGPPEKKRQAGFRDDPFGRDLFRGERVRLAVLQKDDAAALARWTEDAGYLRLQDTGIACPESEDSIASSIDRDNTSSETFVFGIRRLVDDALIGTVGLSDVDWANQAAWVSIGLGNRPDWNQGYGGEAMELLLRFAFDELNLYRLQLTAIDYNLRAIALYEKLGFVREGLYREFGERDGRRYNLLLYGLLRSEWRAKPRKASV